MARTWTYAGFTYTNSGGDIEIVGYNRNAEKHVSIPSSIGGSFLRLFSKSGTVRRIGKGAFRGCGIRSVILPDSLESVADEAFAQNELVQVILPANLKFVGIGAFRDNKLKAVEIESLTTVVAEGAFAGNPNLTCPSSGREIRDETETERGQERKPLQEQPAMQSDMEVNLDFIYEESDGLLTITGLSGDAYARVEIPAKINGRPVVCVGKLAFADNNSLTSVVIPNGVTCIEWCAFYNCINLTSVVIPDSVKAIGANAFSGCRSLSSVVIPDGVSSIGNWAFKDCRKLTSLAIPSSVKVIGMHAFRENSIHTLSLGQGLQEIGQSAFYKNSLSEIVIPSSVTAIGGTAFSQNQKNPADLSVVGEPGTVAEEYARKYKHHFTASASENPEVSQAHRVQVSVDSEVTHTSPSSAGMLDENQEVLEDTSVEEVSELTVTAVSSKSKTTTGTSGRSDVPSTVTSVDAASTLLRPIIDSDRASIDSSDSVHDHGSTDWTGDPKVDEDAFDEPEFVTRHMWPLGHTAPEGRAARHEAMRVGDKVHLVRDLQNNFSDYAIEVFNVQEESIGYLSGMHAPIDLSLVSLATALDNGSASVIEARVLESTPCSKLKSAKMYPRMTIEINLKTKFEERAAVLTHYYDWDAEVIIPSRFKSVGPKAFLSNQGLTRVHLPESLESIGAKAFAQCPKLVDVNITESLAKLGQSAFMKTPFAASTEKELSRVEMGRLIWYFSSKAEWILPAHVTSISNYAFASCEKLRKLTLHNAFKRLTQNSFNGCSSLRTLVLAQGLGLNNFTPLMNSNINKVVLSSGETITVLDPAYFACFEVTEGEVVFNWSKLADRFDQVSAKLTAVAEELLFRHLGQLDAGSITKLAELLIRKAVEADNSDELNRVLGLGVSLGVNYEELTSFASSHGRAHMAATLLGWAATGPDGRKRIIRTENEITERSPKVVKVRFPDMRVYNYNCSFDVQVGDIVEPEGKRAGSQGVVVEVVQIGLDRGAYMQGVIRALRIIEEEIDLDWLLESEG